MKSGGRLPDPNSIYSLRLLLLYSRVRIEIRTTTKEKQKAERNDAKSDEYAAAVCTKVWHVSLL